MSIRALSFGRIAEAYERFRPGYPPELLGLIADYAGRPIRTALEIGAGTGKATRLFTGAGIAVTATEPDPAMLAELRRQVPGAATRQATFEQLTATAPCDVVYAAAALHWTTSEGRWPRIAALLDDGGTFANFGGPVELIDKDLETAVREARAPDLDSDDIPSPDGTPLTAPMLWPGTEMERSGLFTDVRQRVLPRRWTVGRDDFVGYLSTVSAYLQLPPNRRRRVFDRIAAVLPPAVDLTADLYVHLGRLAG